METMQFPPTMVMKKNIQTGKKLHWALADPMQE
jgi:hypothetical protein